MSAITTHVWLNPNPAPGFCKGCGLRTEGWGGKPGIDHSQLYPLCGRCGGKCCGDCGPGKCEFGLEGSPSACSPPEDLM